MSSSVAVATRKKKKKKSDAASGEELRAQRVHTAQGRIARLNEEFEKYAV